MADLNKGGIYVVGDRTFPADSAEGRAYQRELDAQIHGTDEYERGRADERRAVVEWLRGLADNGHQAFAATRYSAAAAIEAGDHRGENDG